MQYLPCTFLHTTSKQMSRSIDDARGSLQAWGAQAVQCILVPTFPEQQLQRMTSTLVSIVQNYL